ncbi:PKD domain-containing protein [Bacteroidota bacterium]
MNIAAQSEVFFDLFYTGNCAPLTVNFTNNSYFEPGDTIGPVVYKWFINDSIAHVGFNMPDSTFQSGWYNIRLEVEDLGGPFWRDYWIDLEVMGLEKFFSMPEEPCPNEMIHFYIPTNAEWLVWKFPNGDVINQHDAYYSFSSEGSFEVRVTGSTECGVDSIIQNIDVSNSAMPTAEIWTDGDHFCPNDEIKFESAEATSYEWDIDGIIFYDRVVYYAFASIGEYVVNLTTTNSCGNTNTTSQTIYIEDTPEVNTWFNMNPQSGCPGAQIEFEASGAGSYFWDLGDGTIAYDRIVTNTYSNEGIYIVTLTVTNGCGYSASSEQTLEIATDSFNVPEAYIWFDEFNDWIDTLKVCPNSEVKVINDSWGEELEFTWDVVGEIFHSEDLVYSFVNPGLNTIMLIAQNRCGGSDTAYKYVVVTDTLKPMSNLAFAPNEMCPNEFAYFWDEGGNRDNEQMLMEQGLLRQNLVYDIDFGDGDFMNGITGPTVTDPEALAAHQYAEGTWNFEFTAHNSCYNYDTLLGQIIVDNDDTRVPFYSVENSTDQKEDEEFEDWSIPVPDAHEFTIGVHLTDWNMYGDQDSTIYIYFWYGEIDPNGDPEPPNGYVELIAPGTVTAYVPFNNFNQSIGIASIWYCNKDEKESDVQVFALPIDTLSQEVQSFPIEPNGITDLTTLPLLFADSLFMQMSSWDGACPPSKKLQNKWFYQSNEGYMVTLGIWEDDTENLVYQLSYGADIYDNYQNIVSEGNIYVIDETIMDLQAQVGDSCGPETTNYTYQLSVDGDSLEFISSSDACPERYDKLLGGVFKRDNDNYDMNNDCSGCPGDEIKFSIIGGESYEWHFEDGSTTVDPITFHTYADTGTYYEYVVATNACSRVDTIYTTVRIDTTNIPWANWSPDNWNIRRFEDVQFYVFDDNGFGNKSYYWNFGDGTNSDLKEPIHMFTIEGDYPVTLTVSNGCGSSSQTMDIYVMRETADCEAKFSYDTTGLEVTFMNNSLGDNLHYVWEFGDGTMSEARNPVHTYPHDGIFEAKLMIQDTVDFCSDEIFVLVKVGEVQCFADFVYSVNNTNNSAVFSDQSIGSFDSWFWEFGDGSFSTDQNPAHAYMYPGVYIVCLSVHDEAGTGCMTQYCKEVVVGSVDIFAQFNYVLSQQDMVVQFFDDSDGDITHWYWEFGDGEYDTVPDPEHIYTEPGFYPVCLSVYNDMTGAFDYTCQEMLITGDTSATMTQADFSFFIDPVTNIVTFTDESMGATNWYWTFGDGTFTEAQNITHPYTAPGIYEVCLTVFSSVTGENANICKQIQVGTLTCNIQAEFEYYINPEQQSVQFSNVSTGIFDFWFWEFGDGTTSTQQSVEHIYTEPGFYLVSLAVRNSVNDCIDYYADFIQVGIADCKSDFDFTITNATNNTVSFEENSIGNIGEYFWFFGDGNISEIVNPTHSYDHGGMYNVSLTVIDQAGLCMDYMEKEIQIGTIDCNASFETYVDSLNKTAYFTNNSVGTATNLFWFFGDGTISEDNNPIHQYYAPGYYHVSLTTFNNSNGCMDFYEKVILIGSPGDDIQANFIYQSDPATKTVTFFNESQGEGLTYIWDFGDGITSNEEDPVHPYGEGGYQFVCLTATNASGMQNTICDIVKVSEEESTNCLAEFIFTADSSSKKVEFTDQSYGSPDVWEWIFDDGSTSTLQHPDHTYADTGYYLVGLHIYNSTTDCESRFYELVNVGKGSEGIQASFTYFLDTSSTKFGSKGKPADILGTRSGGGSSLSWSYGDKKIEKGKVTATTLRPTHIYENPGIYNCCLTIEDPIIGQSDTYCNDIKIPYETLASESICEGESYNLFGIELTTAGTYIDTTTSTTGVDSIVSLTLTVNPIPDKPIITEDNNILTSSIADSYQWYLDDDTISGATNQTYTPTVSGDYYVIVANSFGCNSVSSDTVSISLTGIDLISKLNIKIFPNPMQDYTRINYKLNNTSQISITVYDALGNQVANLINTYKPAGDHQLIWRNPGLSSGVYYLVIQAGNDYISNKLIIQK